MHATYLYTECVTKSCDLPDCLIQTCYKSASSCVTETTFLTWSCETFVQKFKCGKSYQCIAKYCITNRYQKLLDVSINGLFIATFLNSSVLGNAHRVDFSVIM